MWSKIYLVVLALSVSAMVFFTYYSWSWLQSIGLPAAAIDGFNYHSGLSWTVLWLSAAGLLAFGNAALWTTRRAWALWSTLTFFAVFVIVRYFWLDEAYLYFRKTNALSDGSFSIGPFFAVILIALAGIIVFFDQFIVLRLHRKMYPLAETIEPSTDEPLKS